jgi:hypothetical protein
MEEHPAAAASASTSIRLPYLGSGLIDPEEDCCGEADGGEEGVGAAVIAHGDASPVF